MAHIIESRTRNKLDSAAIDEDTWDLLGIGGFLKTQLAGKADGKRGQTIEIPEDLQKVITNTQACLSERLVLNCLALKNIPGSQQFFPAYILHLVLLGQLKFSSRRLPSLRKHLPDDQGLMAETFLNDMSIKLLELLSQGQSHGQVKCDIADLVDGRLFFVCSAGFEEISSGLCAAAKVQVEALSNYLGLSSMDKLVKSGPRTHGSSLEQYKKQDTPDGLSRLTSMLSLRRTATGILPFSSEIFDKYLATVKLDVDVTYPEPRPVITIYYDITHWHSAKKFLGPKKNFQETALKVKKELRWNQFFMAEMLRYAESLTNAAGKGIEAQVIISKQKGSSPKVENVPREPESSKQMPLSGKQTAKPPKLNSKDLLRQKIAQDNAEKDLQSAKKVFQAWKAKRAQIEESSTISARYRAFEIYLENVPKPRQKLIRPEVRLCQIQNLLILWAQGCQEKRMADGYSSLAAAVYLLYELSHCALSKVEARCCQVVVSQLNIPLTFVSTDSKRVLSFEFFLTNHAQQVPIPWVEFMLLHYGPYMVRNLDSQSDSRVSFEPDAWQVKVLDEIDKNHSVFVVAPTSAGKVPNPYAPTN